jgi:predicted Rossmann-fold nucleotide-binding protein
MADNELNSQMDDSSVIRAVCVYCGSSPGADSTFMEASRELGRALAGANLKLIYGGGTTGLMGAVAHGTLDAGGEVGAIIPSFLINREANQACKRSICTVCSWRQEGCNLIPIRFDGNQIDEANGTRTAAGIEELHPGVSGNGGR